MAVSYGHPTWARISEIRAASQRLPAKSHKPEHFLAGSLFPVFRWNVSLEQPMVYTPSDEDGGSHVVDANFDEHTSMQRDAYLKPGRHDEARCHGKLRCKIDRMSCAMHVLHAVCKTWSAASVGNPNFDVESDWGLDFRAPPTVPKNPIALAHWVGDHGEKFWRSWTWAGMATRCRLKRWMQCPQRKPSLCRTLAGRPSRACSGWRRRMMGPSKA